MSGKLIPGRKLILIQVIVIAVGLILFEALFSWVDQRASRFIISGLWRYAVYFTAFFLLGAAIAAPQAVRQRHIRPNYVFLLLSLITLGGAVLLFFLGGYTAAESPANLWACSMLSGSLLILGLFDPPPEDAAK